MIAFAVFVLIVACSFIWAAYAHWLGLSLNLEVKPAEILTLAVSIIIVVLLQYYLASAMTDLRAEKDLLIDNLRDALGGLRSCREVLNACHDVGKLSPASGKQIVAILRRLSNSVEHVETAVGMSQCGGLSKELRAIRQGYLNLKIAATGGNFPSKPYTASSISDQEQACRLLATNLQALIFCINKHR